MQSYLPASTSSRPSRTPRAADDPCLPAPALTYAGLYLPRVPELQPAAGPFLPCSASVNISVCISVRVAGHGAAAAARCRAHPQALCPMADGWRSSPSTRRSRGLRGGTPPWLAAGEVGRRRGRQAGGRGDRRRPPWPTRESWGPMGASSAAGGGRDGPAEVLEDRADLLPLLVRRGELGPAAAVPSLAGGGRGRPVDTRVDREKGQGNKN